MNVERLGGLPLRVENAGSPNSGVNLLEVLVYGDVNMTGVDFVKETYTVVLPPQFPSVAPSACH